MTPGVTNWGSHPLGRNYDLKVGVKDTFMNMDQHFLGSPKTNT